MVTLSHVQQEPRQRGAARRWPHVGERMRRALRTAGSSRRRFCRTVEHVLRMGVSSAQPVDTRKRIRLCNINALGGAAIMAAWAYFEASFGDPQNLPWELAFLAGFLGVLASNASHAHRAVLMCYSPAI